MYFINNEEPNPEKKSKPLPKPVIVSKSEIQSKFNIALQPELSASINNHTIHPSKSITNENKTVKRVYGRARANLSFSSFYIFCEDFRKQLNYLYPNKSETYYKSILNYMWKHLNIRDKHKYYETATKARTMYNLPELPYHAENDQEKLTCTFTNNRNTLQPNTSSGSKVVGKLVKVQFSKSCTTPIITPLAIRIKLTYIDLGDNNSGAPNFSLVWKVHSINSLITFFKEISEPRFLDYKRKWQRKKLDKNKPF